MEGTWRTESYNPSSACEVAPYQRLELSQLEAEVQALQSSTKDISEAPYDPEAWLNRGNSLRLLGYPELALGDIYKARLLVEAALSPTSTPLGTSALQNFSKKVYDLHMTHPAYEKWKSSVSTPELLRTSAVRLLERLELQIWTEMMEGLIASNCCSDYLRLSKEAVEKFPGDDVFPSEVANAENWFAQREAILRERVDEEDMTEDQMQSTLLNGGVYPTAYPWMTEDLVSRGEEILQKIKEEFKVASTNSIVARSTIRNAPDGVGESELLLSEIDVLGVIATTNIQSGQTILTDPTVAGVISSDTRCPTCCGAMVPSTTITNTCCTITYCSTDCSAIALATFHQPLCSKDLTFLNQDAESATKTTDFSLDSLLLLKVLAFSIQDASSSPSSSNHLLKTSLLARLTPTYDMQEPQLIIFNFSDHIITPIRTLQALDIDPFADAAYDTWILHTIRCRVQNNKHGQTLDGFVGSAVNPLYSMFNHSCAPNVDWRHDEGNPTSKVTMFAEKEVAEGEELFISYIRGRELAAGRAIGRAERQAMLMGWFGMECACVRCEEEKEEEVEDTGDEDGNDETGVTELANGMAAATLEK